MFVDLVGFGAYLSSLALWTMVNFIQEQKQSTLSNVCLHNFPIASALQLANSKKALTMADVHERADGWIPLKTLQNFLQRFFSSRLVQGRWLCCVTVHSSKCKRVGGILFKSIKQSHVKNSHRCPPAKTQNKQIHSESKSDRSAGRLCNCQDRSHIQWTCTM